MAARTGSIQDGIYKGTSYRVSACALHNRGMIRVEGGDRPGRRRSPRRARAVEVLAAVTAAGGRLALTAGTSERKVSEVAGYLARENCCLTGSGSPASRCPAGPCPQRDCRFRAALPVAMPAFRIVATDCPPGMTWSDRRMSYPPHTMTLCPRTSTSTRSPGSLEALLADKPQRKLQAHGGARLPHHAR